MSSFVGGLSVDDGQLNSTSGSTSGSWLRKRGSSSSSAFAETATATGLPRHSPLSHYPTLPATLLLSSPHLPLSSPTLTPSPSSTTVSYPHSPSSASLYTVHHSSPSFSPASPASPFVSSCPLACSNPTLGTYVEYDVDRCGYVEIRFILFFFPPLQTSSPLLPPRPRCPPSQRPSLPSPPPLLHWEGGTGWRAWT